MKITHNAAFSNAITHGFYGRRGGVSAGIYTSLNCGPGSSDDQNAVTENRRRVAADLGAPVDNLISLCQVHSPDCLVIIGPVGTGEERPKADAMATDVPGVALGVLTADCGPVLFEGVKPDGRPVIGAAHAGWGGAVKGVLESTLDRMIRLGAVPESIRAAVGPCIGPASYEVSAGFEAPFLAHDPESERFFKGARKEGHMMFDLPGYIAFRLANAGVGHITITGVDTYKEETDCFSYRRATHRGEGDYGRQVSAIVIKA
jgi:hypothetical protein